MLHFIWDRKFHIVLAFIRFHTFNVVKGNSTTLFLILYCLLFRTVLQVEYRISKSLTGLFFGVVRDQTRSISKGN